MTQSLPHSRRKILVTGATGLVGHRLCLRLLKEGFDLAVLSRSPNPEHAGWSLPTDFHTWSDTHGPLPAAALDGVTDIIHLAGSSVGERRWNTAVKKRILTSRVDTTQALVQAVQTHRPELKTFIGASAIGIYGHRGDEELDENSRTQNDDFLAQVCHDWEAASADLPSSPRKVLLRIGLVLSRPGGLLEDLAPVFRSGLGGPLGSGRQWMSWIHIDDLIELLLTALNNPALEGPVNAVAPHPVRNREFTRELAQVFHRPALLPAPYFGVRCLKGEFARSIFASQKVLPKTAVQAGFSFQYSLLSEALADLYRTYSSDRLFTHHQWLKQTPEQVFEFFSSETNLERITPPWVGFQVLGKSTAQIEPGTLIDYRLQVHGFPLKWRTRIEDWQPPRKFVDTQLKGPYKRWHHTHSFEPFCGGTLMTDTVFFRLPCAPLTDLALGGWVSKDVEKIFAYRRQVIREVFA